MTTTDRMADALLLDPATRVTCPECEHEFSLEEGFAKKSLEAIEAASGEALRALIQERDEQHAASLKRMRELEKQGAAAQLARMQELLAERDGQLQALVAEQQALVKKEQALEAREHALQDQIAREAKAQAEQLAAQARAQFEEELAQKAETIRGLQAQELELRRERARLQEARQALELEAQRKFDEQKRDIEERIRAGESEKARLREADLQKTIDDMRAKLEEAQRKSEQGSQQLQGEVLELLLEEQLAQAFPLDEITEVKKGMRGGDAVHTVMTRSGQAAGIVLWEAKRAQRWSGSWCAKLKDDMREAGALAGVIVTTSFPGDWPGRQPFGLYEGVWVASAAAAIPMAAVLREGLLEAHKARVASANKGEKMEAVYDYLTSPQFAHKLKAVYEVFGKLRAELESERTQVLQRLKRREKQIEQATVQLVAIAGDLQGLAQQDLPQLELVPAVLEGPGEEGGEEGASAG